ncbi:MULTISPECIES: D-alanyl-D-alanine carboxypeptidase family protein [unclassified Micromonospora]|uniref:D-alanyl-D-alanine carboxypeptidase family protein n=1 Tax=unclassified Micromonospora TaxID=2617518 RepID=UPI001B367DE1|nr:MULTISPECIES: serine hydrolase [unclassified Micromonospora]MBQ1043068.1 D-alanyl-D-alanine carboxypeptidase [Micromonospora sp. C72]MBQ1056716.1 D-alanyl-D-alanine carboxypeptidase [Micromonospora sp. C32]
MRARVLAVATAVTLLAAGTPAPASATPVRALAPAATAPCPRLPAPKVSRPPRPTPPPSSPEQLTVGGEALAGAGLVTPPGSPAPPAVTATTWLVADLDTGAVLGACGPHVPGTPASTQKLLLAATMLNRLDPKQVAVATRADLDIEPGSSAVGLLVGGRYSVETLWLGLILQSGNDAANMLARLGAGSARAGVAEMNAQARRLGAGQTHAVTPSGLDGPGQFTSAYDLALIARACFADDAFRRYALTERTQIPAQPALKKGGFQIQNENQLIYRYPGALGGKTGFTELARHSYVGAAQRDGRRLVVTLLGAEARPVRGWQQGAQLLDWGFGLPRDASVGRLVEPGERDAEAAELRNAPAAEPARTVSPPWRGPAGTALRRIGDGDWRMIVPVAGLLALTVGGVVAVLAARRSRRVGVVAARRGRPRRRGRRRA